MHEFLQVENAVQTTLKPLKSEGLKTLDAYSGELGGEDLKRITYQFPCIYVTAGSLTSEVNNRIDQVKIQVLLIVGARNLRGGQAAANSDNGVYEWLYKAKELLHRQLIIPGWRPFERSREFPMIANPQHGICVYGARYLTECRK